MKRRHGYTKPVLSSASLQLYAEGILIFTVYKKWGFFSIRPLFFTKPPVLMSLNFQRMDKECTVISKSYFVEALYFLLRFLTCHPLEIRFTQFHVSSSAPKNLEPVGPFHPALAECQAAPS